VPDAAYRFVRHEPDVNVVLFGTGDPEHLRTNIASILKPPLPEADRRQLAELFGHLVGVGLDAPHLCGLIAAFSLERGRLKPGSGRTGAAARCSFANGWRGSFGFHRAERDFLDTISARCKLLTVRLRRQQTKMYQGGTDEKD